MIPKLPQAPSIVFVVSCLHTMKSQLLYLNLSNKVGVGNMEDLDYMFSAHQRNRNHTIGQTLEERNKLDCTEAHVVMTGRFHYLFVIFFSKIVLTYRFDIIL